MEVNFRIDAYSPAEMAERVETMGVAKAKMHFWPTFALSVLAGTFIAFGAQFYTVATANSGLSYSMEKLIGGLAFSLGLILVIVAGAELFTGNNLIAMAWADGKVSTAKLMRNWALVYIGNFIGSMAVAVLVLASGQWRLDDYSIGVNALSIAKAKVDLSFATAFARGVLCNVLVCLAVWLCFSARTVVDKIAAIIFPITGFVASGFEHSIANMYFIPMGLILKVSPGIIQRAGFELSELTRLNLSGFINNLIPVTLGNIVGGSLLVALVYWSVYLKHKPT